MSDREPPRRPVPGPSGSGVLDRELPRRRVPGLSGAAGPGVGSCSVSGGIVSAASAGVAVSRADPTRTFGSLAGVSGGEWPRGPVPGPSGPGVSDRELPRRRVPGLSGAAGPGVGSCSVSGGIVSAASAGVAVSRADPTWTFGSLAGVSGGEWPRGPVPGPSGPGVSDRELPRRRVPGLSGVAGPGARPCSVSGGGVVGAPAGVAVSRSDPTWTFGSLAGVSGGEWPRGPVPGPSGPGVSDRALPRRRVPGLSGAAGPGARPCSVSGGGVVGAPAGVAVFRSASISTFGR